MFYRSNLPSLLSSVVRRIVPFLGLIVVATIVPRSPALAEQVCRPKFAISSAQMSDVSGVMRKWRAQLVANTTACANKSGKFAILFTRLLEYGPDAEFVETFAWREGVSDIELEFSFYESVADY